MTLLCRRGRFALSLLLALLWLCASAALSLPWIRSTAQQLPLFYVLFVIVGIALLPGYLMCAMFLSNLLNQSVRPVRNTLRERVTVMVCARNEQDSIYQTIAHLVQQSYKGEIDILCVDNGSTDQTTSEIRRAIRQMQTDTRRIRLCVCGTPGKAHALNTGLKKIHTRFFITVDADTLLTRNAVSVILQRISDSGAGCVAGNLLVAHAKNWVQKMQIYDYLLSIAAVKRYQGSYNATLVAQGAFSAFDTQAVKAVGGWTQGAGEDIMLTYRLLGQGYASVYEPQAIGHTMVPDTLIGLCRQRTRWARGMFEGLRAVTPWGQPSLYTGYFEALNLSIVYLDLAYVFGFLVGVVLLCFGLPLFVGWMTLLMLPGLLVCSLSVYRFQQKVCGQKLRNSLWGFVCFLLFFQTMQSLCSLVGYAQSLTHRKLRWKQ